MIVWSGEFDFFFFLISVAQIVSLSQKIIFLHMNGQIHFKVLNILLFKMFMVTL